MMSRPPKEARVASINWDGNAGSVTSPTTAMALPPAFRIAPTVSSAGVGSISLTTTEAPSAPSFFAEAAPIPRPEPVTIATLPSIIPITLINLLFAHFDEVKRQHRFRDFHHLNG